MVTEAGDPECVYEGGGCGVTYKCEESDTPRLVNHRGLVRNDDTSLQWNTTLPLKAIVVMLR